MYISKLSLVNYRNFSNASFIFKKGINTIIGENGSGKTNVFRAIRLLLEDSFYQFAYRLDINDFNRKLEDRRGHWIIISVEFEEISDDEAIQSLFVHGTGVLGDNSVEKAAYNLFFRPKADIRKKLSQLALGDKDGLKAILETINISTDYETFFTGKSTADFNDEATYKELVGDFETVEFNFDIDSSKFGTKIPHQLSVAKEVSFTFIKALRDVVADFHNNRKNPLLTLLKNKSGKIKGPDFEPISDLVTQLNESIETLTEVQNIRGDIGETIKDAVGETYSPSSLSIKSNLSNEADKLLQSLNLFIGEPGESHEGGIHELSLGGANLIFLTLKLLEYKYRKTPDTFANFLIIEEPEAHIHTHIQKTLFSKLDFEDTQIIYSTHSTHISDVSNVSNMNILARKNNYAEVYQPTTGLPPTDITKLQRYLDAIRSNLLFAKGVILVEGDAEEILIPIMVKEVLGVNLDELGISLINIRSTGFKNVAQLFHSTRVPRKCAIITDLDKAICNTTIAASDSPSEEKYKTKVANSAKKGAERQTLLDTYCAPNEWVEPFYAEYTFEVDFIKAGNEVEVEEIIEEVYTDAATITIAKAEINSGDIAQYGKRVLTMAKKEGKGWFAIMLGEHIYYETFIPEYILKAIIFAKSSFSRNLIVDIIRYRINENSKSSKFKVTKEVLDEFDDLLVEYQNEDTILAIVAEDFEKILPNDQLNNFLKLL